MDKSNLMSSCRSCHVIALITAILLHVALFLSMRYVPGDPESPGGYFAAVMWSAMMMLVDGVLIACSLLMLALITVDTKRLLERALLIILTWVAFLRVGLRALILLAFLLSVMWMLFTGGTNDEWRPLALCVALSLSLLMLGNAEVNELLREKQTKYPRKTGEPWFPA